MISNVTNSKQLSASRINHKSTGVNLMQVELNIWYKNNIPNDIVNLIASFTRLSTFRKVMFFYAQFAAACKLQRMWRNYRTIARFKSVKIK